jgi:hypothetical protein
MNIDNWTKAFENLGAELVTMKLPMKKQYIGRSDLTIVEERHLELKEMTIHSMYGKFYCNNPKCKSKNWTWTSTSCNTSMYYRFDKLKQRGEIIIESG